MELQILNSYLTPDSTGLFSTNQYSTIDSKPLCYNFIVRHLGEIDVYINILPYEDLNKNKPWILDVAVQGWTWYDFKGDIIAVFNDSIRDDLLNGSAYLLLNHEWESHTYKFLISLYEKLKDSPIDPKKIIYMCHGADLESLHNEVIKECNIPIGRRITTIFSPHLACVFHQTKTKLDFFNRNDITVVNKPKKYLFLNRQPHIHRIEMTSLLSHYDLLEQGYVSLGHPGDAWIDPEALNKDPRMVDGFSKIKDNLPLLIDTTELKSDLSMYNSLSMDYYVNSYFSLVSATIALDTQDRSRAVTEKEFKTMLAQHPFLLLGRPYTLRHLKDMGFMTFDKWFDEAYDEEPDLLTRMTMLAMEVKRLVNTPNAKWEKMLSEMIPILRHNYNRVANYSSERCYFTGDLKKLLYYVA